MTATNHVVTGALLAAAIPHPAICLPLALASHLALDSIPHYGVDPEARTTWFTRALLIDMTMAGLVLLALLISQPAHYWLLIASAIVSASPDLLSIAFFVDILRGRQHHFGVVMRFLKRIQWSETIPGLVVEAAWLAVTGSLLLRYLS